MLERAVINASGPKLRLVDELKRANKDITLAYRVLADIEREYVVRVLEQINWKVSSQNSVSEILDFDRSTLRASMRMLKIQNN